MVAFLALAASLALAPAAVADIAPPTGAVGGRTNPAAGVLDLSVQATDSGLGLSRAAAALDGQVLAAARFSGAGACVEVPDEDAGTGCPASDTASLQLPTTGVADGPHTLTVIAQDAAGNIGTLVDETITVANTPPDNHSSVTITVGSGQTTVPPPGSGPGGGGVAGEGDENGCRSPRLSVFLSQRPVRYRHGVPVLARGRAYRFVGRLTCRIDGRRRSARRGTVIEVRSLVRGRVVAKRRLKVRRDGRISERLAYRSSRVLVFHVRGTGGTVARVRIPIRVVRLSRARAAQDGPGTDVGGTVPSFLKLAVEDVAGFASFPRGAGDYELDVRTRVTASDPRARLTVADGDAADGRQLGHLASAGSVLSEPLEARAGGAFASLDATVEPLLEVWSRPVANELTTVRLRQRVAPGERLRGTYSKTIYVTLSPDAP